MVSCSVAMRNFRFVDSNITEALGSNMTLRLRSLTTLHFVRGQNWTVLPAHLLSLPKLRQITGVDLDGACANCSLIKGFQTESYRLIRYTQRGYTIRQTICTERTVLTKKPFLSLAQNGFFPRCMVHRESCRECVMESQEIRNVCLELGGPVLIAIIPAGLVAFALSATVLVVTLGAAELRKKPSMILVSSLACSDLLVCAFALSISTLYQVLDEDNFDAYLESACPYLGMVLVIGFSSTTHISFLITIERFLVIVYPFKPHLRLRSRSCSVLVVVFAFISLTLGIWTLYISDLYRGSELCLPLDLGQSLAFTFTAIGTGCLLYITTVILYCKIFAATRRSRRDAGSATNDAKVVTRIGMVIGSNLFLSFLPAFVMVPLRSLVGRADFEDDAWMTWRLYFPVVLTGVNTLVNPLLYAFRNRSFLRVLKRKLCFQRPRRRNSKISGGRANADTSKEPVVLRHFRQL